MTLMGQMQDRAHMRRETYEEDDMKTERELHKRNNRLANLSNRTHTNSTTLGEKASRVQKVIKKIFSTQLTAKKTCGNMPGTLCVLVIIQNSKEGVDPRAVKQITGFNTQKVHKILYKLFKHGEIRINGGGLYAGVKENFSRSLGRMK
jgi:hypothetical protein